jgi:hypothetical protein
MARNKENGERGIIRGKYNDLVFYEFLWGISDPGNPSLQEFCLRGIFLLEGVCHSERGDGP